jgi:class 3 adenylate cyclase
MSYGRALMIKAGYKGSTINEVVWMGDVVNDASRLCGYGCQTWFDRQIMVSRGFRDNLNERNQGLLVWNSERGCYHGDVVNIAMENWYSENCTG